MDKCLVSEAMDKCQCDFCKMIREARDFAIKVQAEMIVRELMHKAMEKQNESP